MDTLDTFDNPAVENAGSSGLDTFDDGSYTDGNYEEQGQDSTEGKKETTEGIDPDSQVNLLDDQEENEGKDEGDKGDDDKGDKESDKPDEESKDGQPDKTDDKPEVTEPTGKVIKAFKDGKGYEVPQEATVRVKVNGKNELVPVQELINNYSGKTAWDTKFTELSKERDTFKQEFEQYTQERDYIREQLTEVRSLAEKALSGEANPLDFVNNLLDQMNINSYDFNKALRSHLAEEFEVFSEMTEAEREAYWLKQKTEYLERKQETSMKQLNDRKAQEELIKKVDSLRQTHGVSEDQYVSAFNDLSELGYKDITPEQIVKYAAMVEPTAIAESLVTPYLDQLSDEGADELIVSLAKMLYEDKSLTPEQVKKHLAEEFEVETLVSELNSKVVKEDPKPYKAKNTDASKYESFDDFE